MSTNGNCAPQVVSSLQLKNNKNDGNPHHNALNTLVIHALAMRLLQSCGANPGSCHALVLPNWNLLHQELLLLDLLRKCCLHLFVDYYVFYPPSSCHHNHHHHHTTIAVAAVAAATDNNVNLLLS
jgi:hypothetical protein